MEDIKHLKDGKQLILDIKKEYPKLSKGQKLIAQYIMNHYDKAAFMTTSKLAEEVGVSESTVVRFANTIGFSGYPKFQEALQELIKNKLTTVQRVDLDESFKDNENILQKILKSDADSIKDTAESLNKESFDNVVNKVLNAKKVYILGPRSSFVVAQYLGFYLEIIMDNVHVINMEMNNSFEQVIRIGEGDVIISISFPRYSKQSFRILSMAKDKGASVIAITDSLFAPAAKVSDEILLVKSNMASFVDSLVPAMSLINAFIVSIGMSKKDEIKNTFDDLENIWEKYSIYE